MSKWLILAVSALTISTTTLSAGCRTCGSNHRWSSRNYSNSQHRQARMHTYYTKNSNYRDREDDKYLTADDREVLQSIHEGLDARGFDYDQNNVQVSVEYGKVVFDGRVDSERERELLREVAVNLPNVNNVIIDVYVDDIDPNPNMGQRMNNTEFRR